MIDFGTKLEKALAARGWADKDLAREAGISYKQIREYRRGRATPQLQQFLRIVSVLRQPPDFWLKEAVTAKPVALEFPAGKCLVDETLLYQLSQVVLSLQSSAKQ